VQNSITYVGMDVHKKAINVTMLLPGEKTPVEWELPNEPRAVHRLARKLKREASGEVQCCYEAGPCGYALQRQLKKEGIACVVVAPSLIPVKPGERLKTDKRDARKLAELFQAGLLTEVHPPTEAEEAVRDLCRCREDAKEDLQRCRHRLIKMLLRRGFIFSEGRHWTKGHRQWLRSIRFEHPADQAVLQDYLLAVEQIEERLKTLESALETQAETEPYRERVGWLRCFRGIDTITAMTILAELHDFTRFHSARGLMKYLGLVPSEHSSSDVERRGPITKTGNIHVRRVLVEASWHYRHPPRVSKALSKRRVGQPAAVISVAEKASQRLYRRFSRLAVRRGKSRNKAVTAVARELVGFIWAVMKAEPALKREKRA
jgi:transposase